jgi:hypothetical protein
MTEKSDWIAEARRRLDAGVSLAEVARSFGCSVDRIRYALDLNGEREKKRERSRLARKRERESGERKAPAYRPRIEPRLKQQIGAAQYAAVQPEARPVSLPQITLLAQPDEDQRPQIRLAPIPRVTVSAGAERIRAIHQSMIRRGLIPERSDLVERLSH